MVMPSLHPSVDFFRFRSKTSQVTAPSMDTADMGAGTRAESSALEPCEPANTQLGCSSNSRTNSSGAGRSVMLPRKSKLTLLGIDRKQRSGVQSAAAATTRACLTDPLDTFSGDEDQQDGRQAWASSWHQAGTGVAGSSWHPQRVPVTSCGVPATAVCLPPRGMQIQTPTASLQQQPQRLQHSGSVRWHRDHHQQQQQQQQGKPLVCAAPLQPPQQRQQGRPSMGAPPMRPPQQLQQRGASQAKPDVQKEHLTSQQARASGGSSPPRAAALPPRAVRKWGAASVSEELTTATARAAPEREAKRLRSMQHEERMPQGQQPGKVAAAREPACGYAPRSTGVSARVVIRRGARAAEGGAHADRRSAAAAATLRKPAGKTAVAVVHRKPAVRANAMPRQPAGCRINLGSGGSSASGKSEVKKLQQEVDRLNRMLRQMDLAGRADRAALHGFMKVVPLAGLAAQADGRLPSAAAEVPGGGGSGSCWDGGSGARQAKVPERPANDHHQQQQPPRPPPPPQPQQPGLVVQLKAGGWEEGKIEMEVDEEQEEGGEGCGLLPSLMYDGTGREEVAWEGADGDAAQQAQHAAGMTLEELTAHVQTLQDQHEERQRVRQQRVQKQRKQPAALVQGVVPGGWNAQSKQPGRQQQQEKEMKEPAEDNGYDASRGSRAPLRPNGWRGRPEDVEGHTVLRKASPVERDEVLQEFAGDGWAHYHPTVLVVDGELGPARMFDKARMYRMTGLTVVVRRAPPPLRPPQQPNKAQQWQQWQQALALALQQGDEEEGQQEQQQGQRQGGLVGISGAWQVLVVFAPNRVPHCSSSSSSSSGTKAQERWDKELDRLTEANRVLHEVGTDVSRRKGVGKLRCFGLRTASNISTYFSRYTNAPPCSRGKSRPVPAAYVDRLAEVTADREVASLRRLFGSSLSCQLSDVFKAAGGREFVSIAGTPFTLKALSRAYWANAHRDFGDVGFAWILWYLIGQPGLLRGGYFVMHSLGAYLEPPHGGALMINSSLVEHGTVPTDCPPGPAKGCKAYRLGTALQAKVRDVCAYSLQAGWAMLTLSSLKRLDPALRLALRKVRGELSMEQVGKGIDILLAAAEAKRQQQLLRGQQQMQAQEEGEDMSEEEDEEDLC